MTIDMGEPKPRPEPPTNPIPDYKLDDNFKVGNDAHLNPDDFGTLYAENTEAKRVISKGIRDVIQQNIERAEKGEEPLHWVCASGYLHNMDKIAAALGDGTKRLYRNWGAQQFIERLDSSFTDNGYGKFYGKKIYPIRRERKSGDTSDEFEFWVMGVTAEEVEKVLLNFESPVQEEIAGQRLEASVGISTSVGVEISGILADVIEEGEPDDVMLSRLRRENLLNRLGRELVDNGKIFSPHEAEVLRRAKILLERDEERKLTVSTAKLEAEKDIQLEEKDEEIAKLRGQGEPERRPNSRFHTDISNYMKKGHSENSARGLVLKDVMREKKEAELEEVARIDPLTGLRNRRWLSENLSQLIKLAKLTGHPLSLVVIDVDRFKKINDLNGHFVGDEVLRKISSKFRKRSDTAVRLGGDEFALVLPQASFISPDKTTGVESTSFIIERLFDDINEEDQWVNLGVQPTVSVGVVELTDETGEDLLDHADKALYKAKQAGRNQVFRYQKSEKGRAQFSKVEVSPRG